MSNHQQISNTKDIIKKEVIGFVFNNDNDNFICYILVIITFTASKYSRLSSRYFHL